MQEYSQSNITVLRFTGDAVNGHEVQFRGAVPLQPVQHQPGGAGDPRALPQSQPLGPQGVRRSGAICRWSGR